MTKNIIITDIFNKDKHNSELIEKLFDFIVQDEISKLNLQLFNDKVYDVDDTANLIIEKLIIK